MSWLAVVNAVIGWACILVAGGFVPKKWYDGFVRGLHNTIGITTPTDRQVRAVLVAWMLSALAIVDGMALLLRYVF